MPLHRIGEVWSEQQMLATRYLLLATSELIRHCALRCIRYELRVLRERAAGLLRLLRLPRLESRFQIFRPKLECQFVFHRVDRDGVAVLDDADRSALCRFRGD